MKTSQAILLLAATVCMSSLVGCSAKIDAGSLPDLAFGSTPESKPQADGVWKTACLEENGLTYRTELTIANQAYQAKTEFFFNANCEGESAQSDSQSGSFSVGAASSALHRAYEVNYSATFDGKTEMLYDLMLIESNKLYLGDYQGLDPQSRPQEVNRAVAYIRQ